MSDRHNITWREFLRSRPGMVLIAFLAAAGFLLAYEHRVHIFSGNGVIIGLLAFCVVMHLFMHHGHGNHDGEGTGRQHDGGDEDGRT